MRMSGSQNQSKGDANGFNVIGFVFIVIIVLAIFKLLFAPEPSALIEILFL